MVCLWLIFTLMLFIVEPLLARRRRGAAAAPGASLPQEERRFAVMQWMHWVLLAVSLITVFGAVAGSHGWPVL